jgi:hypothetical protein
MEFKLNIEDVEFLLKVFKDSKYVPALKDRNTPVKDKKRIEQGHACAYSIVIQSKKGAHFLTHYIGGLILTNKEEDLTKELEEILENFNYIDNILKDWEVSEAGDGPPWKK